MTPVFAFIFGSPGFGEMLVIGIIAVLLFGKRLPEVGRNLGRSLVELKKGLGEIQSEITQASSSTDWEDDDTDSYELDQEEPTAPKFEPPVSEPQEETTTSS